MATQITKKELVNAHHRFQAIQKRIANIREKAEATTERLVATAETAGAAFAVGVMQGRTGGVEVFGVPAELGLGIALTGFGLLGGAGKHSSHLTNIGAGCLAAYTTTLGRGVGATWKQRSLPAAAAAGYSPAQAAMAAMGG